MDLGDGTDRLAKLRELTAQQREVLRLKGSGGLTNSEIANKLVVNLSTVKSHVNDIRTTLGITTVDPKVMAVEYQDWAELLDQLDDVQLQQHNLGEPKGEYETLFGPGPDHIEEPTIVVEPAAAIPFHHTPMPTLPRRPPVGTGWVVAGAIVTLGVMAVIRTGLPTLPEVHLPGPPGPLQVPELPVIGELPGVASTPEPVATPQPVVSKPLSPEPVAPPPPPVLVTDKVLPENACDKSGCAIPFGARLKTAELCRTKAPEGWVDYCLRNLGRS